MTGITITKNTLTKGMSELQKHIFDKSIPALRAGENVARSGIASGTPVRTSRLLTSIKSARPIKGGLGDNSSVYGDFISRITKDPKAPSIEFGTGVPYAPNVEFGGSSKPNPFFSTGLSKSRAGVKAAILSELKI